MRALPANDRSVYARLVRLRQQELSLQAALVAMLPGMPRVVRRRLRQLHTRSKDRSGKILCRLQARHPGPLDVAQEPARSPQESPVDLEDVQGCLWALWLAYVSGQELARVASDKSAEWLCVLCVEDSTDDLNAVRAIARLGSKGAKEAVSQGN